MESEPLSLSWNDHSNELISMLQLLLSSNSLVDCTLAAEGQYLKAHKVVLSACSPYFKLLFSQESEKNPIIILKDVKFKQLKTVVDFMYCGEVKIPENELHAFFDIAALLCIKGFTRDHDEAQKTVIPDLSLPETKEHYCSRENLNTLDAICLSVQPCIRNTDMNTKLHLYHQTSNTVASTSTTSCTALPTYNTTSNSALFTSIYQEKQNNSEKQYSIPTVQMDFNPEKVLQANYETVVKTECDADIYEDSSTVFVNQTICENGIVEEETNITDKITENTDFGSNQSTSPHQYSCYLGNKPKDFLLTDRVKNIVKKCLNNKIIRHQNRKDCERRQEKQKPDIKASAVSLLAQKVRKPNCLRGKRHKPRAEMSECELLIERNRTRERVRKYRERKRAEMQIC